MLLNVQAQLPQKKPKVPSRIVKRNSKQTQNLLPSYGLSINGLAVASTKPLQIPKKPSKISFNSLNDTAYLQRLLAYQEENFTKIYTSKTKFFPLGSNNSMKTQEMMIYIGQKEGKVQFSKLSDFDFQEFFQIRFSEDLQKLLTGNLIEDFKKVGWIILQGDQWGFLLDLESLEEPRTGNLPSYWKNLVGTEFFFNKLKQEKPSSIFRNRYVASTKNCPKLSDALMSNQKEDVKWMYNLEQNHAIEIREMKYPQGIHFFDTGYCLTNFQTQLTKAYNEGDFFEIPGGVLNSQTGSGKTASIIELISLESRMKNHCAQSLVITSEYTLFQWKQEFDKFAPHIRVLVIAELSDLEKLSFDSSDKENSRIQDYDVILTHRRIFEDEKRLPSEIFNVNFQRVILDDIHEILTRYTKKQELFEEMRFAQIQYLTQQENDLNASNKNKAEFLQIIQKLQKKFLWGISSSCTPARIAQAFQNLLSLDLSIYSPERFAEINKSFLELHFRTNSAPSEDQSAKIEKSVIKVQPYSIHNFYLNPASAKDLPDQDMIKKITQSQLAEFKAPDSENNCVSEALEIIHHKQQSDIRKIQTEAQAENSATSALNERIEALKGPNSFYAEAAQLLQRSQFECSVCLENHPAEKITMLSCLHHFCEGCYSQFSEDADISKCPICIKFINAQDLIMHPLYRCSRENKFTFLLKEIQQAPPKDKIVIFAQYHSVLKALAQSLNDFDLPSLVLKGDWNETFKTLKNFKENSDVRILLMTIKQGKSGVNVPEANHVFFVQPLFEANRQKAVLVYKQCVGRVLRMGQNKKVSVKLFLMDAFEDHVEDIFMEPWN